MSAERQANTPERTAEHQSELDQLAAERLHDISKQVETAGEAKSAENRIEAARQAIEQHAETKQAQPVAAAEQALPEPMKVHPMLDPIINYRHTLASMQAHLKPASRTFSKIIHNPAAETTSDALEKTIARPSILNGALWTALIVGGVFYLTARSFGYPLSGSTMLFALAAGAIIGVLGEIIWRAFKRTA